MFVPDVLVGLADEHEFIGYAVHDTKADSFAPPAFWRSPVDAIRNFESSALAQQFAHSGLLFTHPCDFVLYAVCGFDSITGRLTNFSEPIAICDADLDKE